MQLSHNIATHIRSTLSEYGAREKGGLIIMYSSIGQLLARRSCYLTHWRWKGVCVCVNTGMSIHVHSHMMCPTVHNQRKASTLQIGAVGCQCMHGDAPCVATVSVA